MIFERHFTPDQYAEFVARLESEISRAIASVDCIRDSINVSFYLACDDLSQDQEITAPRDSK